MLGRVSSWDIDIFRMLISPISKIENSLCKMNIYLRKNIFMEAYNYGILIIEHTPKLIVQLMCITSIYTIWFNLIYGISASFEPVSMKRIFIWSHIHSMVSISQHGLQAPKFPRKKREVNEKKNERPAQRT